MRALDIYQNYCWSFESDSPVTLRHLRAAAAIVDPAARNSEFDQITHGRAYRLVGDATAFELADDFFDEIRVEYIPTTLKRLVLMQKLKRWINPAGRLHVPEAGAGSTEPREERYIPLRRTAPALVPA
jgi:hypothetical protein